MEVPCSYSFVACFSSKEAHGPDDHNDDDDDADDDDADDDDADDDDADGGGGGNDPYTTPWEGF